MRRRRRNTCLLGLVLLISSMGVLPHVVFCVGDGGHRALELVSRDCCPSNSAGDPDSAGSRDGCASKCNDVSLAPRVILKSHGNDLARDGIMRSSAAAAMSAVVRAASPAQAVSRLDVARPPSSPAPRQRHTTVQLC